MSWTKIESYETNAGNTFEKFKTDQGIRYKKNNKFSNKYAYRGGQADLSDDGIQRHGPKKRKKGPRTPRDQGPRKEDEDAEDYVRRYSIAFGVSTSDDDSDRQSKVLYRAMIDIPADEDGLDNPKAALNEKIGELKSKVPSTAQPTMSDQLDDYLELGKKVRRDSLSSQERDNIGTWIGEASFQKSHLDPSKGGRVNESPDYYRCYGDEGPGSGPSTPPDNQKFGQPDKRLNKGVRENEDKRIRQTRLGSR